MVWYALQALCAVPSVPVLGAALAALAARMDVGLDHWLDTPGAIPGDMEGTLLLFYYDQQDEADALGRWEA